VSRTKNLESVEPLRQAFQRKEIATILSNVVAMTTRPAGFEPNGIPKRRLAALRNLAMELSKTLKELQDEGFLRPEEAVHALAVLALHYQILYVVGSAVIPKQIVSQDTLDAVRALMGKG
jgi:hypothetical protein